MHCTQFRVAVSFPPRLSHLANHIGIPKVRIFYIQRVRDFLSPAFYVLSFLSTFILNLLVGKLLLSPPRKRHGPSALVSAVTEWGVTHVLLHRGRRI